MKHVTRGVWKWGAVGLLLFSTAALPGCRSIIEEPTHAERPDFEVSELTLAVGETAFLPVTNASSIELLTFGEIIDVEIDGFTLSVTGIAPGKTTITLRADGQTLRCEVTVYGDETPDMDETEEERQANLADGSVRAVYGKLSLRLDDPGTIFKCSADRKTINVISLSNGENLTLILQNPLSSSVAGEDLSDARLLVNGTPETVVGGVVEQVADGKFWLRFLTPSALPVCRFVIPASL